MGAPSGLATSARLIREQPETVYGAVKAVLQATDFLNHHRQEAIELARKRISHLSREDTEGNYEIHTRDGGYTCSISEEGIRYQSEVLALAKGVSKQVGCRNSASFEPCWIRGFWYVVG